MPPELARARQIIGHSEWPRPPLVGQDLSNRGRAGAWIKQ
jgi:hypothetical protein